MNMLMTWAIAVGLFAGAALAADTCGNPACCTDPTCDMPCCK